MALLLAGATILDGVAERPIEGRSILIEDSRITAIGAAVDLRIPFDARVIDARGKYVIPGLMNANVHLLGDARLETLVRYIDQYVELIAEAAQVALKNGLTTIFDTWGPRRFLMAVRDRIAAGELPGSRIYCAGNIVGFEGPLSQDFFGKAAEVASAALVKRINAIWVENVGRHLLWLTPEQVAKEVRAYIGKGINFLKYASNDHTPGAFLTFSPLVQRTMIEEAHRAGITAQAHCMSVEGLRIAIEAGCDLITHCNFTGPTPIPERTLELFGKQQTGAVVFPFTRQRLNRIAETVAQGAAGAEAIHTMYLAADTNVRNLIDSGARLMLANDAFLFAAGLDTDPAWGPWIGIEVDNYLDLNQGHFFWFKAMEEKGCAPMAMLKAATHNIAVAYGLEKDLGTIEPGKIADLIILDRNPLADAENYRSIHMILKDGAVVNRDALPLKPILTQPTAPLMEEEAAYIPFLKRSSSLSAPGCPMCISYKT